MWIGFALGIACGREDPRVAVEEALLAPCCWRESVLSHDSEIAARLRREVESRLAGGEPAEAIEASIVARYGERIRALPPGHDPRWAIGVVALAGSVLVFGLATARLRRRDPVPVADAVETEAQAARLDDELAGIE